MNLHFICCCPAYSDLREGYLKKIFLQRRISAPAISYVPIFAEVHDRSRMEVFGQGHGTMD